MTALFFEGRIHGAWVVLAIQKFGDPPATISHNYKDGRDVYATQVFVDHATISKLPFGVDIVHGVTREIDPSQIANAELVKRLAIGESCELMLKPDRAPKPRHLRYRCVSSHGPH
jgi:hypothetical protein